MSQGKLEIVKKEMDRLKINILGISELKWTGLGYFKSDDYTIYDSGHEKQRKNGVALIIQKDTAKTVISYNVVNDRLISVRLRGAPYNMTIIQVYAPTTDAEEEEMERFYDQVQTEIDNICKQDALILLGDWNAKVGKGREREVVGQYGLGNRNETGERLIDFCEYNSFYIVNTFYNQPNRRLYTWTSPDGTYRNQIDYIIGRKRWKSSIVTAKTWPGADCGTDHELLMCKFRMKLKKNNQPMLLPRYDLENIPATFKDHVKNRFDALNWIGKEPEELWTNIKEILNDESKKKLKKISKKKKAKWMSNKTLEIAMKRREVKAFKDVTLIKELNKDFQREARMDKEQYYNRICTELEEENRCGRTRSVFQKIREIKKKFQPRIDLINDATGRLITEAAQIKRRWKEYTEDLYKKDKDNAQDTMAEVAYAQEPMIMECEVRSALRSLPRRKATGVDGIATEILLATEEESVKALTRLCQQIWQTTQWPRDWKRSVYIPIPKKGDMKECTNYRTISLISHASKVMLKIIQRRLQPFVERELPDTQAGFRKGRGTRDIIADARWIIEKAREYQKEVNMCFIDYSKAFDSVDHI